MSQLAAFIIGSGGNIGKHTAAALKARGYRVAVGSRSPARTELEKEGYVPVAVDVHSADSVRAAFAQVNKELGPPSVVVFNVATLQPLPTPGDPLTLSHEALTRETAVALSVFLAAQEALAGFRSAAHGTGGPKTFIVTGNALPWVAADAPGNSMDYFSLNIQKLIAWRLMEVFSARYAAENIRFYYATLVGASGDTLENLGDFFTSGPLHAKVYVDLATRPEQDDWDYRFTLDGKKWSKE
ncbi:hypothetical protein GGX14DRAFT_461454 [Mycena pura]|uniref:NAD(P)-binding protein n=1 Tax=Mycena pura TaxID=153505 RepID=A0AAD6YD80_9AGAR|nr:hypothetical protein GGX14DRAFT_461454 [Mycena pura]